MQRKHVRTCRCNIGMEIHVQMYNLFLQWNYLTKIKKTQLQF